MGHLGPYEDQLICCITERPLAGLDYITVFTAYKATWPYPVHGNFITGLKNLAVAYLHPDFEGGYEDKDLIYVVEFRDNGQVIYHSTEDLELQKF